MSELIVAMPMSMSNVSLYRVGGGFVNLALEKRRGFELGCMDRSVRVLINLYACVCDSSVGFWIGMSVGYDAD